MDQDQEPCESGPSELIDTGYATDARPAVGSVFSNMRQQTRAERELTNRNSTLEQANAETSGGNVRMPTGNRRIKDGPPKRLQIPTTVDADSIALNGLPRRKR